jgi:hypothetical protein
VRTVTSGSPRWLPEKGDQAIVSRPSLRAGPDQPQGRRRGVGADHGVDIRAPVPSVLGAIGVVERGGLTVVAFHESHVALLPAGADPTGLALQRVSEPAAAAPSVRTYVDVVADPDDPDRREGAPPPVGPQRRDANLVGRIDQLEVFERPVVHAGSTPA